MQIQSVIPPKIYGKSTDEYFVRFWEAKNSQNIKAIKSLQNEISLLPTEEKLLFTSLIEEIEETIHPKEDLSIDFSK